MTIDISYYDRLNDLVCPFCLYLLSLKMSVLGYRSDFKCVNDCLKIRTKILPSNIHQWDWFSIHLDNDLTIFIYRSLFNKGISINGKNEYFPHFSIFDYSLLDLRNKIKNYLMFT